MHSGTSGAGSEAAAPSQHNSPSKTKPARDTDVTWATARTQRDSTLQRISCRPPLQRHNGKRFSFTNGGYMHVKAEQYDPHHFRFITPLVDSLETCDGCPVAASRDASKKKEMQTTSLFKRLFPPAAFSICVLSSSRCFKVASLSSPTSLEMAEGTRVMRRAMEQRLASLSEGRLTTDHRSSGKRKRLRSRLHESGITCLQQTRRFDGGLTAGSAHSRIAKHRTTTHAYTKC